MMRADVREDLAATMARCLRGLRTDIADIVELYHYLDLNELLDKAIKVERRLNRRDSARANPTFQSSNWRTLPPKREEKGSTSPKPPKPRGFLANPTQRNDPKAAKDGTKNRSQDTKCFKC